MICFDKSNIDICFDLRYNVDKVKSMIKSGLYRFLRPILTFLMKVIFRPKVIGSENISKNGRMVLAGNHTNILDPVLLLSLSKRTIHFLAKKELVDGPLGFAFRHMGIIPVNRGIKDKSVMPAAEEVLNNDEIIGIFPEGTTEKGRGVLPFKIGAVKMASDTKCPILPFATNGKYGIFKRVVIVFGKPYMVESDDLTYENEKLRNKVIDLIKEAQVHGKNK